MARPKYAQIYTRDCLGKFLATPDKSDADLHDPGSYCL